MKKLVSALTAFALLCALIPSFVSAKTFTDTQGHWAQGYISELSDLGIINGYPDGSFQPDNNITRAEYVVMCNNAFPAAIDMTGFTLATEVWFNDAQGNTWFGDAIMRAASNGLVNGRGDGTFDPNAPITRQEAAVITYNYLVKIGFKFNGNTSNFTDFYNIATWAQNAVNQLCGNDILTGYTNTDGSSYFDPTNNITRAETAAIVDRAYNMVNAATITPTPTPQSSTSPTPTIIPINSQTINDRVVRAGTFPGGGTSGTSDIDAFLNNQYSLSLTTIYNVNCYPFYGITGNDSLPAIPSSSPSSPADLLKAPLSLVQNGSKDACIFYGFSYSSTTDVGIDGGGNFDLSVLQNLYPNLNFRSFYATSTTNNGVTINTTYYIATRKSDPGNAFGNQLYLYLNQSPSTTPSAAPTASAAPSATPSPTTTPTTTPITYTITFDGGNCNASGTLPTPITGLTLGQTVNLPYGTGLIDTNGFPFDCWSTIPGVYSPVSSPYTVTGDVRLYAFYALAPAKPIIYLYPTVPTDVTVTLGYPDQLGSTYPQYNNGWNVLAQPNGDLTDLSTGRSLYGLYWEGGIAQPTIDEGFCVPSSDAIPFLQEKLAILGLNEREADEFIIYWLPIMQQNPYNYVKFLSQDEINKIMPLTVTPTPDSIIRVLMVLQGGDQPINIPEQQLTPATRSGFSVVEWGGTIINDTIK